jgi:signal transduction histidine kinase
MSSTPPVALRSRIQGAPLLLVLCVAAVLMFALALGGIWLTREGGRIASIWVANAAILSIVLSSARDRWAAIKASAFIGNILANIVAGDVVTIAVMLASCNLVEIVIAATLIRRFKPDIDFTRLQDLTIFCLVAGIVAPLVTALLAASMLAWMVAAPFVNVAINWYASDALGLLVFVPLLMIALGPNASAKPLEPAERTRSLFLLGLNFVVAIGVFYQSLFPLLFVLIPPLVLIAFRAGSMGAVIANGVTTVVAIGFTVEGYGPITLVDATLPVRMAILQLFLATCVFVTLVVAAYLAEQKRLEDRLRLTMSLAEKANAAKSNFLSTVSHELRTPLTSIRGSLGLVSAGVAGPLPPKAENLVRIAYANCERLVRLINDILDMEKIESGKMTFDIQRHSLRAVLEQAVETATNYMPEKKVRILLHDDVPGAMVEIDVDRMHQVVTNLLSNAIKFSPPSGLVRVTLSSVGHHVDIAVIDQGPGIPDAFKDRIFGKFEQADSSNTRDKGGTGLGLSISKALVQNMSGDIAFESTEGVGTTFRITLPLVAESVMARATTAH